MRSGVALGAFGADAVRVVERGSFAAMLSFSTDTKTFNLNC